MLHYPLFLIHEPLHTDRDEVARRGAYMSTLNAALMYGKWPYQVCKKDKDGSPLSPKGNYREIAFFMTIYFLFFNSPETAPNMTLATKFAQDVLHYAIFTSFDRRSPMGNRVK